MELPSADTGKKWSQRRQDVGAVLWPSFLTACFGSILCFAFIDPASIDFWPMPGGGTLGRMTGYALGFFFLWIVAAFSSFITVYLTRTAHQES